ncbi:MAG: NAD(P)-dependent oxidoreductase [Thermoleophilaceae bacterium]|nr:NAD(P)-dependent oxidoreductase [Thermoleophilaceae bacterium]
MSQATTVGLIGLGAMGSRLGMRLCEAGHELVIWNRTPGKLEPLLAAGGRAAATPGDAARAAQVTITMLSDASALEAVIEGPQGLAAGLRPDAVLIDMSTIGPAAATWLRSAVPNGVGVLDAPVLGSVAEAQAGTLRILVGGPPDLVEAWRPLLEVLGVPVHLGPAGAGAAAKLVVNASLFGVLGVLAEAVALADSLGLSRKATFESLSLTPLAEQASRRRRVIETDPPKTRFALSLARKDAELVAQAAAAVGLDLRLARAAGTWLADAERGGHGGDDYTMLLRWIIAAQRNPPAQ